LLSCRVGLRPGREEIPIVVKSEYNSTRRQPHLNRNELPVSFPLDSRPRKRRLPRFELGLGLDCSSIRDKQKSELKSKSTSKRPFDRELAPSHFDERRKIDQIQHIIGSMKKDSQFNDKKDSLDESLETTSSRTGLSLSDCHCRAVQIEDWRLYNNKE
jgi:hypothetical protein